MKTVFGLLFAALVGGFIIWLVIILPIVGLHYNTGNGEHTGTVSAVEKTGVIWKTGTAYIKTNPQSSQEDNYCVKNQNVYNQLVAVSETQQKVTIEYHTELVMGASNCNGEEGIIDSVQQ